MKHDVMRRLAAARPGHLDPDRPVDPEVRVRELDRAMLLTETAGAPESASVPEPARRPLWRSHRVWGTALTATAAAVAAAVIVSGTPGAEGVRPGGADAARETFAHSQVLMAAASDLERSSDASGAYWYQEVRSGSLSDVSGKDYTVDVRHMSRVWVAAGNSEQWSQLFELGARPASPADEEAWRADGSPKKWDITPPDAPADADRRIVHHQGAGLLQADAPGGTGDVGDAGQISLAELAKLSPEPEKLRTQLKALVDRHYNAPRRILDTQLFNTVVYVAFSSPAEPELRAAAYRLLATLPGVRDLGEAETHDGRTGRAIAIKPRTVVPDGTVDFERRLFFDPKTGMPMASETVTTKAHDGHEAGELTGYSVVTEMTWTDEKPPFDEDFIDHEPEPADKR